jgi:MYXO-CTERM domain-containing protein
MPRSMSLPSGFLAFAVLGALPSVGHAQVFQPGTQPIGDVDGLMIEIQPGSACANCHSDYDPDDDYEPWDSWRGAMMANAGRDPVFRAALSIAEVDNPAAADFCVRCHSPVAWLRGRSTHPDYDPADTTLPSRFTPDDPRRAPSHDMDGVSCMVCHRSEDPGVDQIHNAQLVINDGPDAEVRFGPYTYPDGMGPPHRTEQSTFLAESRFCGQCHDIYNPLEMGHRRRDDGTIEATTRPFAIERTFSEWANSAFADGVGDDDETCQTCHMRIVDRPVRATSDSAVDELRTALNRHDLAGGSYWQPLAIAARIPDADGDIAPLLAASAMRARGMLESAASLEVVTSALDGNEATATVRVTNLTGHKLPTGYPEGRRMWLEVAVVDASGNVAGGGSGFFDATGHLIHDPQVRTYESELGEVQPDGTAVSSFHFLLNDTVLVDTRIPPAGFDPPAELDMTPVGRDYTDGAGGYRNYDESSFRIPACGDGALSLRVRLRFQSNTAEYIEFLSAGSPPSLDPELAGRSWGEIVEELWHEHGGDEPVDMEVVTVPLGASPMACPEPPDAGVDASMSDDVTVPADAGPPAAGGCACRTTGGRTPTSSAALLLGLALLGLTWARRR